MTTTNKSEDEVADMNKCRNFVKDFFMKKRTGGNSLNEVEDNCCANCGKAKLEGTKLTRHSCDYYNLNHWYCSVECQQIHREAHEAIYNIAMARLLRDKILFKQPESSHLGDCPICCLPIPFHGDLHIMFHCCCKIMCTGCFLADYSQLGKGRSKHKCPFCRKIVASNEDDELERLQKRMEANDSAAICHLAQGFFKRGDYSNAFKYLSKSAELGYAGAHYIISFMYESGSGVERDEKKRIFHLEEAAIGGNPEARFKIGIDDMKNEKYGRGVKHFIIAANQGHDQALQMLKGLYTKGKGLISKADLAAALRAHHDAVCAMKSDNREKAIKILQLEK